MKVELGEALLCSPQHQVPLAEQRGRGLETLTLSTMRGLAVLHGHKEAEGARCPQFTEGDRPLP